MDSLKLENEKDQRLETSADFVPMDCWEVRSDHVVKSKTKITSFLSCVCSWLGPTDLCQNKSVLIITWWNIISDLTQIIPLK